MRVISHRANLQGSDNLYENTPQNIQKSTNAGYLTEIDIWCIGGLIYLGHDYPRYKIEESFITGRNSLLLLHSKNAECSQWLVNTNYHWFSHQTDDLAFTSKGFLIIMPNRPIIASPKTIVMLPELNNIMPIL